MIQRLSIAIFVQKCTQMAVKSYLIVLLFAMLFAVVSSDQTASSRAQGTFPFKKLN
jgi:hypothetical protein